MFGFGCQAASGAAAPRGPRPDGRVTHAIMSIVSFVFEFVFFSLLLSDLRSIYGLLCSFGSVELLPVPRSVEVGACPD